MSPGKTNILVLAINDNILYLKHSIHFQKDIIVNMDTVNNYRLKVIDEAIS